MQWNLQQYAKLETSITVKNYFRSIAFQGGEIELMQTSSSRLRF